MVLERCPKRLLQGEVSLEVPLVVPVTGGPRCAPDHGQMEGFQVPAWNREMKGASHRRHVMLSKRALGEGRWTAAQSKRLRDGVEVSRLGEKTKGIFLGVMSKIILQGRHLKKKKKKKKEHHTEISQKRA